MATQSNAITGVAGRTRAARRRELEAEGYLSPRWILLWATYATMVAIFFLFTPFTHQLDEIKNVILGVVPPVLLLAAVLMTDFGKMSWKTHASTFFLGLWVLAMVVSYVISPYKDTGERVVYFQLSAAAFTAVFAWFMDTEDKMRKTMMVLVLICFGSVVVGLIMFAGQGFTGTMYESMLRSAQGGGFWSEHRGWITLMYTLKESKEMYSTILNSDFFAAFLVMTIPFALSMFFVEDHVLFKVLAVVTALLMAVCLAFTNSNDSFVSMFFLGITYFVLGILHADSWRLGRRQILTFFIGLAALGSTVVLLMMPTLAQTWEFKSEAIDGRYILWEGSYMPWLYGTDANATGINLQSFLFGTGPGGYRFYFPVFRANNFFDNQINNVTTFGHNWYLDILCEFGLFGLLAFLGFHLVVIWNALRQIAVTRSRGIQFYQIAVVASLIGIGVQNVFSPNNRWAVCAMIYWSIFGISMGMYHIENPGEKPLLQRAWAKIAGVALALFAGVFVARSWYLNKYYWASATANARGLRFMDTADLYGETDPRKIQLLRDSEKEFRAAIRDNATFATSYYKLGHVLNQLSTLEKNPERADQAIKVYEDLNKVFPHYSEVHLNLGIMYNVKAQEESVGSEKRLEYLETAWGYIQEAARQSIKANVRWIGALIGEDLAQVYTAAGRADDANAVQTRVKEYYQSILDYKPRLPEVIAERLRLYPLAKERLANLMLRTNDNEGAERILKRMYLEDPENRTALLRLMGLYDRNGQDAKKVAFLGEAVSAAPLNATLRRDLALAYLETGNVAEYVQELQKVEMVDPRNKAALAELYLALRARGDEAAAATYRAKLSDVGIDPSALPSWTSEDLQSTRAKAMVVGLESRLAALEKGTTPTAAVTETTAPARAVETQTTVVRMITTGPEVLDAASTASGLTSPAASATTR